MSPLELTVMPVSRKSLEIFSFRLKRLYFFALLSEFHADPPRQLGDVGGEFVLGGGDGFSEHVLELLPQRVVSPLRQLSAAGHYDLPQSGDGGLNGLSDFGDGVFGLLEISGAEVVDFVLDFE